MIDAHHHLWNLNAVDYPWLMEKGKKRFFGDPTPIQRNYLIDEHIKLTAALGFKASVHIQVGAADGLEEAKWVNKIVSENQSWPWRKSLFVIYREIKEKSIWMNFKNFLPLLA